MACIVHGVAKNRARLSDFHFHFQLKSWRGEGLVGPVLEVCLCWADTGHPQGKPKNTGVGNLLLLQGIFSTKESNWGLLHCRWILYQLSYQGSSFLKILP